MSEFEVAAEKLAGHFLEWDLIEDEKAKLSERAKALFKAMKEEGYDTKAARVSFREKRVELLASPEDVSKAEADEAVLDTYRVALTNGLRSRAHPAHSAREIIEEFDAETGEITEHEQPETATNSTTKEGESDAKSAQVPAEHCDLIDRRRQDAERAGSQPPIPHQNAPAESATDAISAPHSNPQPSTLSGADKPEAVSPPSTPTVSGAYSRPLNPDCRKAARGEQCALMHSQALCSKCRQAVFDRKVAA